MLSMAKVSIAQAQNYYTSQKSAHYDTDDGQILGHFWGKGAQLLFAQHGGLKQHGKLIFDAQNANRHNSLFTALLRAQMPVFDEHGNIMDYLPNRAYRKVGAYDLTTSAPKSVSVLFGLLAAMGTPQARQMAASIKQAVRRANNQVMARVQQLAENNIKIKGKTEHHPTQNLIFAQFLHDDTRETQMGHIDPQLHIHNVLMNACVEVDETGKMGLRSMDNRQIMRYQRALGQAYNLALNAELEKLGFTTYRVEKGGIAAFEVLIMPNQQQQAALLALFSGRSGEIEKRYQAVKTLPANQNKSAAQLKNEINTQYRKAKKVKPNRAMWLQSLSQRYAAHFGVQPAPQLQAVLNGANNKLHPSFLQQIKAKFNAKAKHEQAIQNEMVAKHKIEQYLLTQLQQSIAMNQALSHPNLMVSILKAGFTWDIATTMLTTFLTQHCVACGKNHYLAKQVAHKKRTLQQQIQQRTEQRLAHSLLPENQSLMSLDCIRQTHCTMAQLAWLDAIVHGTEKLLWLPVDEAEKNHVIKQVKAIAASYAAQHWQVLVLTLTEQNTQAVQAATGMAAQTLNHFFIQWQAASQPSSETWTLLMMPDASMLRTDDVAQLLTYLEHHPKTRAILMHDVNACQSAGQKKGWQWQNGGIAHAFRQPHRPSTSFNGGKWHNTLHEIADLTEMVAHIAQQYVQHKQQGDEVMVLTHNHQVRQTLNQQIRAQLFQAASETTLSQHIPVLPEKLLTMLRDGVKVYVASKGKPIPIAHFDATQHTLTIKGKTHQLDDHFLQTHSFLTIQPVGICVGEHIIFTHNMTLNQKDPTTGKRKRKTIRSGVQATVLQIHDNGDALMQMGKETLAFNLQEYGYWDYAYAIADGLLPASSCDHVYVLADPKHSTCDGFYAQASRAKYSLQVYTTHLTQLKIRLTADLVHETTSPFDHFSATQIQQIQSYTEWQQRWADYQNAKSEGRLNYLFDVIAQTPATSASSSLQMAMQHENHQSALTLLQASEQHFIKLITEEAKHYLHQASSLKQRYANTAANMANRITTMQHNIHATLTQMPSTPPFAPLRQALSATLTTWHNRQPAKQLHHYQQLFQSPTFNPFHTSINKRASELNQMDDLCAHMQSECDKAQSVIEQVKRKMAWDQEWIAINGYLKRMQAAIECADAEQITQLNAEVMKYENNVYASGVLQLADATAEQRFETQMDFLKKQLHAAQTRFVPEPITYVPAISHHMNGYDDADFAPF
ncbi:MAG: MobF family relaxase [Alysiella sp.]|uniref:MobF family relaxase n=1 Tax=Alysiella sp. TaxID=1872483 RepID=UPI0026DBB33B|nr:MobF family relaxase [Alysiella sp.]MDO4433985.1 MobF family relaxase [Alysiella sp.]